MWIYKQELDNKNTSKWINKKLFIIIHHTWWWNDESNLRILTWNTNSQVSAHRLIWINWDKYKIWNYSDISRHRGVSQWKWYYNLNKYSIWIEVVWWLWKEFSYNQRVSTKELIQHLMFKFNIPRENVLRHKDITQLNWNSLLWKLWYPWVLSRKVDVHDIFWSNKYKSWKDYQNSLIPLELK